MFGPDRAAMLARELPATAAAKNNELQREAERLGKHLRRIDNAQENILSELDDTDATTPAAQAYRTRLRERFVDHETKRAAINEQLAKIAAQQGHTAADDPALLDDLPDLAALLAEAPDRILTQLIDAFDIQCLYRKHLDQVTIRAVITDATPHAVARLINDAEPPDTTTTTSPDTPTVDDLSYGPIYTVAGDGTAGFAGDGGPATAAEVAFPTGLEVDGSGNLLIADYGNDRVRVVAAGSGTFYGQPMTAGDIYTVAGDGAIGFAGDGGPATSAELAFPGGAAVDAHGNLLIADSGNSRIRAVAASSGTFYGQAMTAGDIYTVAGDGGHGFSGDGGPATKAELNMPLGVAVDSGGNLLIADGVNQRVRVVAAADGTAYGRTVKAGDIYTAAGNGTVSFSGNARLATTAQFEDPEGLATDAHGNLLIADQTNNRVRVMAASSGTFYGQAMTAGDTYTVAGDGTAGFAGDGGPATSAEFQYPTGVAIDSHGNLLIADTDNNRVRVVAAANGTFYGQAMTAGDVYTVAGGGTHRPGNGGPATAARLSTPTGAAVDAAGNLLVADYGNNRLRVVAASNGTFYGQPMTAGDIYTIAGDGVRGFTGDGGPATSTELNDPSAMALDGNGNLVFTDEGNERVRVIAGSNGTYYSQAMTAGDIYTVAGNGKTGFAGDGGPATKAEFWAPAGLLAENGNLVIADTSNYRVRLVAG